MRMQQSQKSYILFARLDDDIVILRVMGRGDFDVSPQLKTVSDKLNGPDNSPRYILDLEQCPSMDSTFMGEVASIALHQKACQKGQMVVLNANPTAQNQLEKLGLKHMLDLHKEPPEDCLTESIEFEESPTVRVSRLDQIVHMIECHQSLIEVDSGNEVKFRAVLQSLTDSLAREAAKQNK